MILRDAVAIDLPVRRAVRAAGLAPDVPGPELRRQDLGGHRRLVVRHAVGFAALLDTQIRQQKSLGYALIIVGSTQKSLGYALIVAGCGLRTSSLNWP